MIDEVARVRQNYLAITLAAVACFLFEAAWYSYFLQSWLDGIGRTREWVMTSGVNPALPYGTAQLTGPQTVLRGMRVAALLWLGCVLTTWGTEYAFEVRTYKLFAINTGFWLLGMVLMGAIVGGWKKK